MQPNEESSGGFSTLSPLVQPLETSRDDDSEPTDDAYVRLLGRHQKQLFRLIYCSVRNVSDAEDLFQQTAITLWDKFSEFEPGSNFYAWAAVIARNKLRDFIKKKSRERVYFNDEVIQLLAEEQGAAEVEESRLQALSECRQKLSREDQLLLDECYASGESVVKIAIRRGCSAGSLYSSIWRIRRALFQCIEKAMAKGEMA